MSLLFVLGMFYFLLGEVLPIWWATPMRVTSKGQVTIPKDIREQAGIRAGTEVDFSVENGRVVLLMRQPNETEVERRSREFQEYLERVSGTWDLGMSTDEFMELLRGPYEELPDAASDRDDPEQK